MTLGSPIDKHLLLWPRLWEKVRLTDGREVKLEFGATGVGKHAIAWRNYYDYGDPVGFKLDTARDWLGAKGIDAFAFCDCERCQHDIGFARYLLPGKAHNDYWDDADVFDHFIRDVVEPETAEPLPANTAWKRFLKTAAEALRFGHPEPRADRPFRPKTNAVVYVLSPLLPYVLSLALLTFGVFILYKAVVGYTHPGLDPVQKFVWYETVGKLPKEAVSGGQLLWHAVAIALLTAGVTLLARLPRLALGARWWFFGALAFLGGAAAYVYGVDGPSRADIGGIYYKLPEPWRAAGSRLFEASLTDWIGPRLDPPGPTLAVLGLALTVALFGLYQALRVRKKDLKAAHGKPRRKKESAPKPRRQRWFFRGMRPLILAGGIAVVLITAQRLNDRGGWTPPGVTLTGEVARVVAVEPAVWPVVLGGAAFLYLWWLAALIFDLGFVWARYVRSAKAIGSLREWSGIPAPDPRKCRLAEEKKVAATS